MNKIKVSFQLLTVFSIVLLLAGCQPKGKSSNIDPALQPDIVDSKDRDMLCSDVHFVVAVDDDDDDFDHKKDKDEPKMVRGEDNFASLSFYVKDAAFVIIAEPQFNEPGKPFRTALNTRVRAFNERKPFTGFGQPQKTDFAHRFTLDLQGMRESKKIDEIIFEYHYYDKKMQGICSGVAYGTVAALKTTRRVKRDQNRLKNTAKLLATADMTVGVSISTKVDSAFSWKYRSGKFKLIKKSGTSGKWKFTAGISPTQWGMQNHDYMTVEITPKISPVPIEVQQPLNLVVPKRMRLKSAEIEAVKPLPRRSRPTVSSGYILTWITDPISLHAKLIRLFDWNVPFEIVDQWGRNVSETARSNTEIVAREDTPFVSRISGTITNLQTSLNNIQTKPKWDLPPKEGRLVDHISIRVRAHDFQNKVIGMPRWPAVNTHLIEMDPHVWHLGIRNRDDKSIFVAQPNRTSSILNVTSHSGAINGSMRFKSVYHAIDL